jgi:predicted ATPase
MKEFGTFRLDASNQCLWSQGKQISIPPKPFAVLRYLVDNPGRLVSHDEMLDALWPDTFVQPQVLRTYVLDLRKILGDDAGDPRFIQTLPKRGYCFVASISERADKDHKSALPAQLARASIVGRDQELSHLLAELDQVAGGQRRFVFITGEAGIGKTALVDEFCRQAEHAQLANIARGQCVQGVGAREEYYPVMEALGQLCASPAGEVACRVLNRMAPGWLNHGSRSSPEPESQRLSAAPQPMLGDLCGALEELSIEKPLLLIFEDLEFADESTLNLLSALARRRAPAKLMLLATRRPAKASHEHALVVLRHDLLLRRLCSELVLAPLAKPAVRALLCRELGSPCVPAGLDAFVVQRAEGNPLFVIAILEHLIAERVLVRVPMRQENAEELHWHQSVPFAEVEAEVPQGLAQMIELEIERLTAEERCILEAGSLMNVVFPSWAVAAALDKDMSETEELCEDLARRLHFVERAGQDELPDGTRSSFFVFAHALYREAIYQTQAPARRGKRHIRIAERLRMLFAGREGDVAREIAMHYEAGGAWREASRVLRVSAQCACARRAFADAADLLDHALRLAENLNNSEREAVSAELSVELKAARAALQSEPMFSEETSAKA